MSALQMINPSGRAELDQSHFNLIFYNNYIRKLGNLIKTKLLTSYYAVSEFSYYISSISFLAVKRTNNFKIMKRLVCILHSQVIIRKHFFQCLIFLFFFYFSVLCKLLLRYLRPTFCTQLNILYFFSEGIWQHLVYRISPDLPFRFSIFTSRRCWDRSSAKLRQVSCNHS